MADRAPAKPDWERLESARVARARREYRETRPGERVEQAIALSRELTVLAASRRRA